jgi:transposase
VYPHRVERVPDPLSLIPAMTGASVSQFWTDLLGLSGFAVVHVRQDARPTRYTLTVVPEHPLGVCPQCQRTTDVIKQHRNREGIRDLPIGDHTVELTVRVGQFECPHCGRCFTPPVDFVAEGAHATERFLDRVAELIRHSDVANAARFFALPEKTLEGWYYAHIARQHERAARAPAEPIRRIGIDELSLKKSTDSSSP